jgi:hypothetical protein
MEVRPRFWLPLGVDMKEFACCVWRNSPISHTACTPSKLRHVGPWGPLRPLFLARDWFGIVGSISAAVDDEATRRSLLQVASDAFSVMRIQRRKLTVWIPGKWLRCCIQIMCQVPRFTIPPEKERNSVLAFEHITDIRAAHRPPTRASL